MSRVRHLHRRKQFAFERKTIRVEGVRKNVEDELAVGLVGVRIVDERVELVELHNNIRKHLR